jgi:putative endonuclease
VHSRKQQRVARAAQHWLFANYGERWPVCRFDVVTVDGDGTIEWIRDAFQIST